MIDAADLQGGIVRGYGQRFGFARHLFARVREPRAARAFLAALADPATTEQEWAEHPATTLNVALSFRALAALELPGVILDGFPQEVREGMAARAERLGDDPNTWDGELRDLEVLVVVHAQSAEALQAEAGRREHELRAEGSGLELAHAQEAALLGEQREHFGFTDGFSQPAIEGVAREDIRGQGIPYKRAPWWPLSRTRWRAVKPGEFVLGYEDEDSAPAPAPPAPFDRNASFMVWRKLHQDVAGFRAQLAEQARRLDLDEELVAAKLVGRWRDGSPLVLRPHAPDRALGNDKERANDFRYGDDPLGLLFVCLQASIARQFEIVQTQWCNDGNAFGLGREADPISGPFGSEVRHLIEGDPPRVAAPLRSYVECRGGEYLVVPAISALRALPAL